MLRYKTAQILFKALAAQHLWMAKALRTGGDKLTMDKAFLESRILEAQTGLTDFLVEAEKELSDNGD